MGVENREEYSYLSAAEKYNNLFKNYRTILSLPLSNHQFYGQTFYHAERWRRRKNKPLNWWTSNTCSTQNFWKCIRSILSQTTGHGILLRKCGIKKNYFINYEFAPKWDCSICNHLISWINNVRQCRPPSSILISIICSTDGIMFHCDDCVFIND